MRNKTVSVRLDSETLERLGAIAKAMDRPRAWLMAHAIPARYVEEQSWQIRAIISASGESVTLDDGVSFASPCFAGAQIGDIGTSIY